MTKIVLHNIKIFLVSILAILAIFLILVFSHNKTVMVVDMDSNLKTSLSPEFYFTGEEMNFNVDKMVRPYLIKNGQYYFSLPDLTTIKYARFDPAKTKAAIYIHKITITEFKWFRETVYEVPANQLVPVGEIENLQQTSKGVKFKTIGGDPIFNANLTPKNISSVKTIHLILLLIAILIYIVGFYLYGVYKTNKLNDLLTAKLILYSLFLALALFKVDYYKDNIQRFYPPDELAHLSYINYVHTHNEIIPKFEDMRMLNNKDAGNYLAHPPLYYKIMNSAFDNRYSIIQNINNFRTLNMIIFIASFLLLLYVGFSSKIALLSHFVYLSVISSIPMYAYSGGSITNDTLAILGGILFIIGLKRTIENNYTNITFLILGTGIFLAYFSKLTAAILIFFALLYFLMYAIKVKMPFKINKIQITLLVLILLPILYYQVYIFYNYHSLMPTFNVTHPEEYLKSVFFVDEKTRNHLTYIEWFERMKDQIVGGWFGIYSHHSLVKSSISQYIGLLLLHIAAIVALFIKCKDDNKSYCLIGKIALLSLFSVLIIQYIFSYQTHLKSGYMGGLQPRYVLPFMFSFAIMSSIFVERFKQYFLFTILIILICIQAIYSDFFYFLQYYQ